MTGAIGTASEPMPKPMTSPGGASRQERPAGLGHYDPDTIKRPEPMTMVPHSLATQTPASPAGTSGHDPSGGIQAHPALAAVLVLAAIGVLAMWRASRRKAQRIKAQAREATRAVSLAGRMLVTAAVIVGAQWAAFVLSASTTVRAVALGVPALFAAHTLTRAVIVTGHVSQTGGRR